MKISKNCYLIEKKSRPVFGKKGILLFFISIAMSASMFFIFNTPEALAGAKWLNKVGGGGLAQIGWDVYGQEKPHDIRIIAAEIIKIALGFLGIVFLVIIIISGAKLFFNKGGSAEITKALQNIGIATVGLIIIFSAWALTNFIQDSISKAIIGS